MAIGVALFRHVRLDSLAALRPRIVLAVVLAAPVYLLALMWANAWFSAGWVGVEKVQAKVADLHWLPFYYHYFSTETRALRSLLAEVAMYVPIGVGYWLWTLRPANSRARGSAVVPALVAALLASAMETGKLFVMGKHPDPTDVPIAMVAATIAYLLAARMHQWALQGAAVPAPVAPAAPARTDPDIRLNAVVATGPVTPAVSARTDPSTASPPADPSMIVSPRSGAAIVAACVLLAGTGVALWAHPLGGVWLALALGSYAALLWRHPGLCLPAILALLPLLDFSLWSGWILVSEFDLFIAVTLAVRLLQRSTGGARAPLSIGARFAVGLLALSFFTSAVVGLFPLSPFDWNALGSYYTSFTSLRQLKGFAWALALLPVLLDESRDEERLQRRWIGGMLAGLCGVVAVILWQRITFAGLADFGVVYRVEGPFPELHTGGGDVHAYLVMAIPFVVAWIVLRPTAIRVALGTALFMLASYALGVTFTRGGYVGYGGAMAVLAAAVALRWMRQDAWQFRHVAVTAVLALAGLAILVPIVSGTFMEARLAGTRMEAGTRTSHWLRAIDQMDSEVPTALFGMGLGTFPKTALFKNPDAASATFSFGHEGDNGFLRLGSGRPLYLDQRVSIAPQTRYTLALDLRSGDPKAKLTAHLCEKSAQYSFRCTSASVPVRAAGTGWEHHELAFDSGEIGSGAWPFRRPVALSLSNAQRGGIVDVDNVRLRDKSGVDQVTNGDFSRGGARWLFAADDHLPWHIFNLAVQILFEQGWFGVIAVGIAVVLSIARLAAGTWRGDLFAATLLASVCGFLLVGLTESLFDGPRVTTLFFLVVFAGLLRPSAHVRAAFRRAAHSRLD